jgi:hypothetical protein
MGSLERVANVPERKERCLYYGGRKSEKFVRCYWKGNLGAFRVELELHSGILRRNDISALDDLLDVPEIVYPKHIQFVDVDWSRLEQHLATRFGMKASQILTRARKEAFSMQRLCSYLRRKGVVNVHRFLVPLAINETVFQELKGWARDFRREQG